MSTFKVVKKKEETKVEEIEDEEKEEETNKKKEEASISRKRMIKFMLIILGGTVGLLLILFIISSFSPRHYTYTQVEEILKVAAQSYFKDHPDNLPKSEQSAVEIDSTRLAAEGKMKNLSEYLDDACTGKVQVQKVETNYIYIPYLNCGEAYSAVEFYNKVVADNPVVSKGYGLYSSGGYYIFRGESINNYVKLDNALWRIVKITPNRNIVLVLNEGISAQSWDDRYNEEKSYNSGINQYSASRIKEALTRIYTNPSEVNRELILSDSDKTKIVPFSVCVGKRNTTSEFKNNTEECKETIQNQRLGLLTVSDYLYASVDSNCKNATSKSCGNYNYLAIKNNWWLATADTGDTSSVYSVSQFGNIESKIAASFSMIRPVITLNSRVFYKEGNGSENNPYVLR